jgi:hypothetical protein
MLSLTSETKLQGWVDKGQQDMTVPIFSGKINIQKNEGKKRSYCVTLA